MKDKGENALSPIEIGNVVESIGCFVDLTLA